MIAPWRDTLFSQLIPAAPGLSSCSKLSYSQALGRGKSPPRFSLQAVFHYPLYRVVPRNAPIAATSGPALTLPDAAAADDPSGRS